MTGYTVHTGASKKFVTGWDRVFTGGKDKKESASGKGKARNKDAASSGGKRRDKKS